MGDHLQEGPVEFGQGDPLDELVHVQVLGPEAHIAGLPAQGACEEGFAASGQAGDEDVFGPADEGAVADFGKLGLGEVAFRRALDVLDVGIVPQPAGLQEELRFLVVAVKPLGFGQFGRTHVDVGPFRGRHQRDGLVGFGHARRRRPCPCCCGSCSSAA